MPPTVDLTAHPLIQVLAALALALLIGVEREEKAQAEGSYMPAGIRTFPMVALVGYAMAVLSPQNALPVACGLLGISGLLVVSFLHKLKTGDHGVTTEMAVLVTYVVGALVAREALWVATSLAVATVLLLQSKTPLERFASHLPREEIGTFVKFLLLAAVILPVLPNQDFTQFRLNPFRTWLVVVAVSGISYASYVVQRLIRTRSSVLVSAALGGIYSSTLATVVLARRSREAPDPPLYAGAILLASGIMYLRLALLVWVFNADLGWRLGPRLLILGAVGGLVGFAVALVARARAVGAQAAVEHETRNPLEVWTALMFAGMFLGISVVTQLAARYLGSTGVYALAAVMGVADVDPFILSLTQSAGQGTALLVAAVAVIIAAASNNCMKGIYAVVFGDRRTGIAALAALVSLAAVSLLTLIGL